MRIAEERGVGGHDRVVAEAPERPLVRPRDSRNILWQRAAFGGNGGVAAEDVDAVLHWQSISDPATAHSNMAALLIEQARYAEARKELDLALGYNRNHAAALSNLKLVSELDGKPAVIPIKPIRTKWGKFRSAVLKAVGG